MGFISNDREQMRLLGYSLDDFVPKDAKCRFIVSMIRRLDLRELYNRYSDQGNDAFEPGIMLATWFFAYAEGITSTRRLEELCKRDMHYLYVSAMLEPDHTSFSRFRQRHVDLLPRYFVQIVSWALEQGLSEFKVISMDGTKMQAASSIKHNKDQAALARYLEKVRADIAGYFEQSGREDLADLQALEQTLQERTEQLEARQAEMKSEHRDQHTINLLEPEACVMPKVNGGLSLPGYNAQISVDTNTQLIVAADVVQDRNDQRQFQHQHQKVEQTLGQSPERSYVADAGYHSLEQLAYVDSHHVQAVIANPHSKTRQDRTPDQPFTRSDFTYDPQRDYFQCPAGESLTYIGDYRKRAWQGRVYQAKTCGGCRLRNRCMPKARPERLRRLHRESRETLSDAMIQKLSTPNAQALLRIRRSTVEPVFGNLKANLGFRRFSLRGLGKVKGEFALMAIAHNLNKLFMSQLHRWRTHPNNFQRYLLTCQRTLNELLNSFINYLNNYPFHSATASEAGVSAFY